MYKVFMGEMIMAIGEVMVLETGEEGIKQIQDFIRSAVADKISFMEQQHAYADEINDSSYCNGCTDDCSRCPHMDDMD